MTAALAPLFEPGIEPGIAPEPPPASDGLRVSEADYWAWYYEGPEETYEWNNGVLEEKGVSDHLTFQVFDWFVQLLIDYLRAHPIAERVGLETGFRLALPEKTAIRRPDYGLIRSTNPRPIAGTDNSYKGIFDLCIEGLSTSSRAQRDRDLVVKKAEYAAAGVGEYYILHHRAALRAFYRLGPKGLYEPIPPSADGVLSSALLPGFRWRLADLDRQPALETLIEDPVYQGYVALGLQRSRAETVSERARAEAERQRADSEQARAAAERQRAEQADQRAEQADQRAAQADQRADQAEQERAAERARAERLAERLRSLGIDPD